jgi:hypothetical protein
MPTAAFELIGLPSLLASLGDTLTGSTLPAPLNRYTGVDAAIVSADNALTQLPGPDTERARPLITPRHLASTQNNRFGAAPEPGPRSTGNVRNECLFVSRGFGWSGCRQGS